MSNVPDLPFARVFVSSTTMDLWEYRAAAYETIQSVDKDYEDKFRLVATGMDTKMPSGDLKDPTTASVGYIDESQWIILIVAWNYGYIADGCGVTESEYRHAVETCKPPKPTFVYLAADVDDQPRRYWWDRNVEKVDLGRWKERGGGNSDEQWARLTAFRKTLREKEFKLFSGLADFKQILRQTLRNRIDRELGPPSDPNLLALLLELRDQVSPCIRRVKLLADLKRIHDALHVIRQRGVRRWREEVLPQWAEGNLASPSNAVASWEFTQALYEVGKQIGTMSVLMPAASPDVPELQRKVDKMLEVFNGGISGESVQKQLDRDKFEQATELFADRVESAFSLANTEMRKRASELQRYVQNLKDRLSEARKRKGLTDQQDTMVQNEIKLVSDRFDELQSALDRHNAWQTQHDWLGNVDRAIGSELLHSELNRLLDRLDQLTELLDDLEHSEEATARAADWLPSINAVRTHLQALAAAPGAPAYGGMRKAFDDLFFLIDKATLDKVQAAERRVLGLEQALSRFKEQLMGARSW